MRDLLQPAVAARRPVCIVRFTHVIASLRGRIRSPGATCTAAKTCILSHSDTDRIFESLSERRTFSALTFPTQRSRFNGQSGSWQSYGLSDDGCHDRYDKQNRFYRHLAELHHVWRLVSGPKGRFLLYAGLCLFSRIVFEAGQNPQKEALLFEDDFMISRSFFELKLQELKVRIVFRDEFGGEEEKQWY